MILKIKTANEEAAESWRFYEGVSNLHYSLYYNEPAVENTVVSDEVQEIDHRDQSKVGRQFVECCFYSDSTGPAHVRANTAVYLLNDSGKTIERII